MLSSPFQSFLLVTTRSQHQHLILKGLKAQPACWCYSCYRLQAVLPHVPASKLRRARQLHPPQQAHQQRARARQQPKGQQSLSAKKTSPLGRQPSAAAMNLLPLPRHPLPHLPAPPRSPRLTRNQVLEETPLGENPFSMVLTLFVCWSLQNY